MLKFGDRERKTLKSTSVQSLVDEFEKRERLLLEAISANYASIVAKCRAVVPCSASTNVERLKEVALKIVRGNDVLAENRRSLAKVEIVIDETALVLKIVRALAQSAGDDVHEQAKNLLLVREAKEKFQNYKFYAAIEKIYAKRVVALAKRVESDVCVWIAFVKSKRDEISAGVLRVTREEARASAIFSSVNDLRPAVELRRVLVPLVVAQALKLPTAHFFSTAAESDELLCTALCFAFLREKGVVDGNFDFGDADVHKLRTIKKLFEMTGVDASDVDDRERELSAQFLRDAEGELGTSAVAYARACAAIGYAADQAEIIDTFFCKKLVYLDQEKDAQNLLSRLGSLVISDDTSAEIVADIRAQLSALKNENEFFSVYEWNCEMVMKNVMDRVCDRLFGEKKARISAIFASGDAVGAAIVKELANVDKPVCTRLSSVILAQYRARIGDDAKEKRKVLGDALVVMKFYQDNAIPGVLQDLC